jgi:hypothetical protein
MDRKVDRTGIGEGANVSWWRTSVTRRGWSAVRTVRTVRRVWVMRFMGWFFFVVAAGVAMFIGSTRSMRSVGSMGSMWPVWSMRVLRWFKNMNLGFDIPSRSVKN